MLVGGGVEENNNCFCETGNRIGIEGVDNLIESLKTNNTLTELDLRGNKEKCTVCWR